MNRASQRPVAIGLIRSMVGLEEIEPPTDEQREQLIETAMTELWRAHLQGEPLVQKRARARARVIRQGERLGIVKRPKAKREIEGGTKLTVKEPKDFSKGERDIFAFLSLSGTQRVVGTGSLNEIEYAADYDLMEYVKFSRSVEVYECILDLFREKYRTAYKSKNIWITDFKCGVLPGGKPIRWTRESIEDGYQMIEDTKTYFVDCLQEKSIIKMDVISLIGGLFHEFSEMYFVHFGDFKTYNPVTTKKENIETGLLQDVKAYAGKGNYYKALKRLFAYLRISERDPALLKPLVDFFNSKVGELSSYKSDLELVSIMLDQKFRAVKPKDITHNLKYIEKHIEPIFKPLVAEILKASNIKASTEKVEEILDESIQMQTKDFIAKTRKLKSYLKV
uniref:Uncharacterized protein n=1 Tax=viral metagenome TaxID=1070528 RepID=A0A6C0AI42_9ZZZZ